MRIQLSDHFTYGKLLRFVIPAIVTMIFTSVYSIVDGLFVSNFVEKTSFAALNLIFPVLMIFGSLGFMVGSGGAAIIAKTLGEQKRDLAKETISIYVMIERCKSGFRLDMSKSFFEVFFFVFNLWKKRKISVFKKIRGIFVHRNAITFQLS